MFKRKEVNYTFHQTYLAAPDPDIRLTYPTRKADRIDLARDNMLRMFHPLSRNSQVEYIRGLSIEEADEASEGVPHQIRALYRDWRTLQSGPKK